MHLQLQQNELDYVVGLLTQQPYAQVVKLLTSIGQQINAQQQQPQPAEPAPPVAQVVQLPKRVRVRKPKNNGAAAAPLAS